MRVLVQTPSKVDERLSWGMTTGEYVGTMSERISRALVTDPGQQAGKSCHKGVENGITILRTQDRGLLRGAAEGWNEAGRDEELEFCGCRGAYAE